MIGFVIILLSGVWIYWLFDVLEDYIIGEMLEVKVKFLKDSNDDNWVDW